MGGSRWWWRGWCTARCGGSRRRRTTGPRCTRRSNTRSPRCASSSGTWPGSSDPGRRSAAPAAPPSPSAATPRQGCRPPSATFSLRGEQAVVSSRPHSSARRSLLVGFRCPIVVLVWKVSQMLVGWQYSCQDHLVNTYCFSVPLELV
ncbi:hypothetical protein PR202_ga02646 [Eleusine coracana subsp. coracana]|uniref:Uncharacterized protein n=1 Tax=Eleusine coracana subsp. coracana TaxID=191504 RepID=A0AAV5BLB4_ELECO|nr:hypothetical protein PR202_ga02646 [Eleusine coracana subsp. coracana]